MYSYRASKLEDIPYFFCRCTVSNSLFHMLPYSITIE